MQKIDLVYMWVDDKDKYWQKQKNKYLKLAGGKNALPDDATVSARWRDNDELKYALRSAEKFVPWINHIYLITGFNQVPKWLNTKHQKITVIDHSDIMPQSALPTFNSISIEMCLANIKNLSEYFLLSNDDMFFNRPLQPDFFFDNKNRALFRYNKRHNFITNLGFELENCLKDYQQTLLISQHKIKNIFNKNVYKYLPSHGIDPYHKSTLKSVLFHPMLEAEMRYFTDYKFRHGCQIQRLIFDLYGIIHGTTKPLRCRHVKKTKNVIWNKIYNFLHSKRIYNAPCYCMDAQEANLYQYTPPIVCINDTVDTTDEMRIHNKKWLDWKFPDKSSFEL